MANPIYFKFNINPVLIGEVRVGTTDPNWVVFRTRDHKRLLTTYVGNGKYTLLDAVVGEVYYYEVIPSDFDIEILEPKTDLFSKLMKVIDYNIEAVDFEDGRIVTPSAEDWEGADLFNNAIGSRVLIVDFTPVSDELFSAASEYKPAGEWIVVPNPEGKYLYYSSSIKNSGVVTRSELGETISLATGEGVRRIEASERMLIVRIDEL